MIIIIIIILLGKYQLNVYTKKISTTKIKLIYMIAVWEPKEE